MHLIVGLGNPGPKYAFTRHNAGFLTVDCLVDDLGISCEKAGFFAKTGTGIYKGKKLMLAKPQTFMNDSGKAVRAIMDYYDVTPEELIVIYDDVDIPVGKLRIKPKGSSGHHNGMKSIISHIGTEEFIRVRMGIGSPEHNMVDHVLGVMSDDELKTIPFEDGAKAVLTILDSGIGEAQSKFN